MKLKSHSWNNGIIGNQAIAMSLKVTEEQEKSLIRNLRQIHGVKHTKTSAVCWSLGGLMELLLIVALIAYFIVDVNYSLFDVAKVLGAAILFQFFAVYHKRKYGEIDYPDSVIQQQNIVKNLADNQKPNQ